MEFSPININFNMELFEKFEKTLKEALKNDISRYWHSISVAITATNLASIYDENCDEALIAGLLHDYCKCMSKDQMLIECKNHNVNLTEEDKNADGCIHGFLAAKICKDLFDINDRVYNAIYFHTCGKPDMNMLEKIIYMSDFIEPLRRFRDKISDIRKATYTNIDSAIFPASAMTLKFLKSHNKFIHSNTLKTMEFYKKYSL